METNPERINTTFSIITPSYNQGEFIEDTIKSVLSQEGDFFLEYIIMDGGSTDDSVEIIKKYDRLIKEGRWPLKCRGIEYRWVSEKDKGQVDAIEKGFLKAGGAIAAWLNSDDIFYNSFVLERVRSEFEADPGLQMVTGDGMFIDRAGNAFGKHHVDKINFTELLYLDYHILQPATFITRALYKNERLDGGYNFCFDAEYFIRIINKGYRYKKLDEDLACFRYYPEIKTVSGARERYAESLRLSRVYGRSRYLYLISAVYKYFGIVLRNRFPESRGVFLMNAAIRTLAYMLVIGKVRL